MPALPIPLISVILLNIAYSSGCQKPWELYAKGLSYGSVIGFRNVTTIGKQESLAWSWPGEGEAWHLTALKSLEEESLEGKIIYNKRHHDQKEMVTIAWKIRGDYEIEWSKSNGKRIFSKPWSLSICDGITLDFMNEKDGTWHIKIDDFVIMSNKEEGNEGTNEQHDVKVRKKREEELEVPVDSQAPQVNCTQDTRGIVDRIYDFFFGEGDAVTGRSDGVFIRVRNWMKSIACRLKGTCQQFPPPPTYPPVVPTSPELPATTENPDAENTV